MTDDRSEWNKQVRLARDSDVDEGIIELSNCELITEVRQTLTGNHNGLMVKGELIHVGEDTIDEVMVGVTFYEDTEATVHLRHY